MEKNDNFIIQLRKGVFDLAILSLISKQPMYGYEITSALQDIPVFHIPNGSIYPILNRIMKNNWAVSYWEESGDGPKRKYYRITDEGREILNSRLHDYDAVYHALMLLAKGEDKK